MIPQDILKFDLGLSQWSILVGYRGSIAHGMHDPKKGSIDDKDIMAVCVPPPKYYLGLKEYGSRGTKELKQGEWDVVVYELRKFMSMLSGGNPNVLGMLWLQPQHYIKITGAGQRLLDNKELFVGRHAYHSFIGYAHGQLHRMTHFTTDAYATGYMGQKRKQLVEKFGYDTKNAAHLIRLLRMGIEFLKDGELHVLRQDGSQLLEIKRGEWSLSSVREEADRLFKVAEQAYLDSKLPAKPDSEKVTNLCVELIQTTWEDRNDNATEN